MSAETNEFDAVIYSDGGSSSGRSAAGACVVEDLSKHTRNCLAVYLGPATNNEAEIVAALLGFSALRALHGEETPLRVKWISDSEYLLKSATGYIRNWQRNGWKTADKKPVKNQGLWRTYLALTGKFQIRAEHVRGHTGHPENEACDEASQWARRVADELGGGIPWVRDELETPIGRDSWTCFDGEELIERLRDEYPSEESLGGLVTMVSKFFSGPEGASSTASNTPVSLRPVLSYLDQAHAAARKLAARSENADLLAGEIESLLRRFR